MDEIQEPKYEIRQGRIHNRATGEAIPDDEPIFILRAKDKNAAEAIAQYCDLCSIENHREIVKARISQFLNWAEENPDRMHEPTSPD